MRIGKKKKKYKLRGGQGNAQSESEEEIRDEEKKKVEHKKRTFTRSGIGQKCHKLREWGVNFQLRKSNTWGTRPERGRKKKEGGGVWDQREFSNPGRNSGNSPARQEI